MNTTKFSEILTALENLDAWLTKLGIKPKTDRVHRAIEVVRQAQEGWRKLRETGKPAKIGNIEDYYFGMIEAFEFCDIFRAFEKERPEFLAPKLERALSGPFRPAEETHKNSDGRNTMFELALAADLRLGGADVCVGEPDIKLTLDNQLFLVECKRPFREHSIHANVRGAADQLARQLRNDQDAAGIIAISVSRVFNPGTKLFVAPSEEDRERFGDRLEAMMREREDDWNNYNLHPATVAVLFHVRTPGVFEDQNLLTKMSYACVTSTGHAKDRFGILEKKLKPLLSY
jgi:hypothetical protein